MAQPPHVVFLNSSLGSAGGLEKYATKIAKGFLNRGARLSVLAKKNLKLIDDPSCITYLCDSKESSIKNWLSQHPHDLVFGMDRNCHQTHLRAGNGVHAAFLKTRNLWTRIFYAIHPAHRHLLDLEKKAFESPKLQKLFTNSWMVRKQILEFYRTDPSLIEVVHNGVEWHDMQLDFDAWETQRPLAAKKFGLDPSCYQLLFIGHGYKRKGLKPLLKAIASLRRRDIQLSVVGKDRKLNTYRNLASRLNISSQVKFFDTQQNVRPFYQLADALAIPSFYDPFANVTIEALAMGLFVISSSSNGGSEILDFSNGTVIEDLFKIDSIVASLKKALDRPKTANRAQSIRESVRHLDFSSQIPKIVNSCLPHKRNLQ